MTKCNVSQSLVYKWRADVKASQIEPSGEERQPIFTEVLVAAEEPRVGHDAKDRDRIQLVAGKMTISLPVSYPVEDLVKVILAIEAQ